MVRALRREVLLDSAGEQLRAIQQEGVRGADKMVKILCTIVDHPPVANLVEALVSVANKGRRPSLDERITESFDLMARTAGCTLRQYRDWVMEVENAGLQLLGGQS